MEKAHLFSLRLDEEDLKNLSRLSMTYGLSRSDVIRKLLSDRVSKIDEQSTFEERLNIKLDGLKNTFEVTRVLNVMAYLDRYAAYLSDFEQKAGEADDVFSTRLGLLGDAFLKTDIKESVRLLKKFNREILKD